MRRPILLAVLAVAAIVAVVVMRSGSDPYTVRMELPNADGLSSGSPVAIGGVEVGKVKLVGGQDRVDVKLEIADKYAPLDRKVKATILARNALGQKQVVLSARNGPLQAAPDGYRLPAAQVDTASDLDQLLNTLDPDTRSRLAVLLNEAGLAFDGRKVDFKMLLDQLGPALGSGTDLLGQLDQDNKALANLLTTSDRFIGSVADERARLVRVIDLLGKTTETVATRRAALRQTLREAPATLTSARSFLAELRRTTGPLASTARRLTATAPPLLATIKGIEPFRAAAKPTLDAAVTAAPTLTSLTDRTTRSLRGALPALDSVQAASQNEIPAVGTALDGSMDNLLATVENWSHAIQFRDGLSHIFRGEAAFGPSFYEPFLAAAGKPLPTPTTARKKARPAPAASPATPATTPVPKLDVPGVVKKLTDKVPAVKQTSDALKSIVGGVTGTVPLAPAPQGGKSGSSANDLLDYLLGN